MNPFSRALVALCLLCLTSGFAFAAPVIALKPGTYAERSIACGDAPFAALKMWDGRGFGGAHSSKCIATVLHARGKTFQIRDTCSALGDGTPAAPDVERATVTMQSSTAFRYTRSTPAGPDTAEYRWCSAH